MQVMLKASYKRQARYTGQAPEMIGAECGEIDDRLMMGELASAVQSVAFTRGDMHMAGIINDAINRAMADGKLALLPERWAR